jgi:hexosaminidase
MKSFLFFVVFIISTLVVFSQPVSIIPQPVSVKQASGKFIITAKTVIVTKDPEEEKAADFFNGYLQSVYGFKLEKGSSAKNNYIRLNTKKFIQKPSSDAYTLMVTSSGVTITGDTYPGTFYGIQSLIQLLPVTKSTVLNIPTVTITDAPRFNYRGMMLDVGRHFFPLPVVKKFIDYIALHKMNYFHWHLTDDQGWRIEIKKYPRLTEIGSTRNNTIIGHYPGTGNDNTPHGGFYTQDEIREVVQYAADRFITVVPEIEMPGHAEAALTAYNWLGCPGTGPYKVEGTWGVFNNVFCAGKDSTFQFLQDVIDEVLELFPSPYIHVGGDECPKTNWKKCPLCQARIKAEGLKDEHGLQSYFVQRMEKYINGKGRKIIGWDEILEGGLAPNATVMSWRGEEGGIDAAKQNHDVVMTPGAWVYFDHAQVEKDDSLTIGGFLPLGKVYGYEPIPKELNAEQAKHVLGGQANLWTEYITNLPKIEYMIFPRMSALSEVLWSPKNQRNWKLFLPRLQRQYKRYELWKSNYSKAVLAEPSTAANKNLNKKK